jgi:pimeloyl-ACP methyl ester carboxylesterase
LGETVLTSTERLVETNGVQLRVVEPGERAAPLVVLAHGFPELAYSWREVNRELLGFLAEAAEVAEAAEAARPAASGTGFQLK